MLARARLIPITPTLVTTERIAAVIKSSMAENPPRVRRVFALALLIRMSIVMVQKELWSKWNDHGGPSSKSGATKVMQTKIHKRMS